MVRAVQPFGKVLDARKQKVALPANPDYTAPPLTVECLCKLDSSQNFNILVASEPKESATHWELYSYAGRGDLSAYLPGYAPSEIRSGRVVADGRWHYCAMTFDGRIVRLFSDGVEVQKQRVRRVAGMASKPGPLCLGHIAGTGLGCDGLLDEVRISSILRDIRGVPERPFEDDENTLALWHFDPAFAATGLSSEKDPFRGGAEAALRARKGLGGSEARAVVVFDNLEADAAGRRRLLEGISWFFDPATVFGCNGFGPITRESNTGTVGILALSNAVTVIAACEPTTDGHEACGVRLGQRLRSAVSKSPGSGELVILFGDCHVPANDVLVRGFLRGYGAAVPVVGGSCPLEGYVYDAGAVRQRSVVALSLEGDFHLGLGLGQAAGPSDIAESAARLAKQAAGAKPSDVALTLLFDCVSRRQALGTSVAAELDAVRRVLPSGAVFGFYGSGEIGSENLAAPARGVGTHLSIVCFMRATT